MAQQTFNDGDLLSVVRATINGNATDAESRLQTLELAETVVNSLADLSAYLVGSTYELPSGRYNFTTSIDFATADIYLKDLDGCYFLDVE